MGPLDGLLNKIRTGGFAHIKGTDPTYKKDSTKKQAADKSITLSPPDKTDNKLCGIRESLITHYIIDTDKAVEAVKALSASRTILGIDIETAKMKLFLNNPAAGLDPYLSTIRLVQVCENPSEVYVFDIFKIDITVLKPLFKKPLVAHNAIFELKHFYHAGIQADEMHCTLLMSNALNGDRISLKDLAKRELGILISKAEQVSDWSSDTLSMDQIRYAAVDAAVALSLHEVLLAKLKSRGQIGLYHLLQQAQYPVSLMEYHGCNFDLQKHLLLGLNWKDRRQSAEDALKNLIGKDVNLSSTKQVSDWLLTQLSPDIMERWPKTNTGQLQITEEALLPFSDLDFINPLLEYKRYSKLLSSFGDSFANNINPVTGRIHPNFTIGGANTGRFTCSRPNLQQLPRQKEVRELICAPEGYSIVTADYSQIELRILAMTTNDQTMLDAYNEGKDLHRLTASKISGIPFEDVTKDQRQAAKAVNFGLVFGMGATGLAHYAKSNYGVSMTVKEAKVARDAFFKGYPGIAHWHKKAYEYSLKYKWAKTPLGRIVDLRNQPEKIYTKSKNIPIQGGAAEVLLAALVSLAKKIAENGVDAKIVNIVHDEIILEVVDDQAEKAQLILEEAMVEGMHYIFPNAVTNGLVEASIGKNWAETK